MVRGCLTAQIILIALYVIMLLKWLGTLLTLRWNVTITKDFLAGLTMEWHPLRTRIVLDKQIGPEQWDLCKLAVSTEELGLDISQESVVVIIIISFAIINHISDKLVFPFLLF